MTDKIHQLTGTRMTPVAFLGMYLERAKSGEFDSVMLTYKLKKDETFYCGYTNQSSTDLLGHAKVADVEATRAFYHESDAEYVPRKDPA